MTRPTAVRRLVVARLEDRTAPALFGPVDNAVRTGTNPYAVVADFNGDGRPDLAAANSNGGSVTVLLGTGAGGFAPAPGSPVATVPTPYALAVADFNGDGRPDLVAANASASGATVLLGDGAGGFVPAPGSPVDVGPLPSALAVGDFNGDGRADLAAANPTRTGPTVTVLLGTGGGGFAPAPGSPIPVAARPNGLAVADFDRDGRPDLAVATTDAGTVTVLLGTGSGGFAPAPGSPVPAGIRPGALAAADFDGDGNPDLAASDILGSAVTVLMGTGTGAFRPTAVPVGNPTYAVAVGDFNGDGRPDLAAAYGYAGDGVAVLLGDGAGGFAPAPGSPLPVGANPISVTVGDFNGDGAPDLAAATRDSNSVAIALNHGATTTTVTSSAAQAVYGQAVTLTATVTADSGLAPTGTVTFRAGAAVLGSAPVAGGTASITLGGATPLAAGGYAVTATFDSDAFHSSTSAPLAQTVAQAPTATTVTGPARAPAAGQAVALTATVTGADGAALGGWVAFRDGAIVLGTVPLAGDVATLPVTFRTTGTHPITAQYLGDANDLGSTSAVTAVVVAGTAGKLVTGSGPGAPPRVNVYNLDGTLDRSFLAYGAAFRGGVRVAKGDGTGDGVDDVIVAPGAGAGPLVRVYDGATGAEVRAFYAYAPTFRGGVFVAAGDVDGDGRADVITGPGGGSAKVRVFSGRTGAELFHFLAYPAPFAGGVRVAAGDVTRDGKADVIVGPGRGPAQPVRAFDLNAGGPPAEAFRFLPYGPKFTGGVYVAAGDTDGDGWADVIVSPGSGPATVQVVSGQTHAVTQSFAAFDPSFRGGASVAVADLDGDGLADIVAGPGKGLGPQVRVFSGLDPSLELRSFFAYDPALTGGLFVG